MQLCPFFICFQIAFVDCQKLSYCCAVLIFVDKAVCVYKTIIYIAVSLACSDCYDKKYYSQNVFHVVAFQMLKVID